VCGLPWRTIFKLRNTVAFRWCRKFGDQIPVEEFLSECNQVIAESARAYTPQDGCTFAGFLYRAMHRRMPSVPRHIWAGTNTYVYERPGRGQKRLSIVLQGPNICELPRDPVTHDDTPPPFTPPALTVPATQDSTTYLHECLTYAAIHLPHCDRTYLAHTLDGESSSEIAHRYGVHENTIQRRLHMAREVLATWADEGSYAAAD
jgi:hypothetical protein